MKLFNKKCYLSCFVIALISSNNQAFADTFKKTWDCTPKSGKGKSVSLELFPIEEKVGDDGKPIDIDISKIVRNGSTTFSIYSSSGEQLQADPENPLPIYGNFFIKDKKYGSRLFGNNLTMNVLASNDTSKDLKQWAIKIDQINKNSKSYACTEATAACDYDGSEKLCKED